MSSYPNLDRRKLRRLSGFSENFGRGHRTSGQRKLHSLPVRSVVFETGGLPKQFGRLKDLLKWERTVHSDALHIRCLNEAYTLQFRKPLFELGGFLIFADQPQELLPEEWQGMA